MENVSETFDEMMKILDTSVMMWTVSPYFGRIRKSIQRLAVQNGKGQESPRQIEKFLQALN